MAGVVTHSNRGPVILIMHQYAHSGKGHSIHSSPQLEWNGVDVDDKSAQVSGKKRLVSFDGFSIPINIICGLPYIDMPQHTDQEWEELPPVLLTGDANWDPTHMDHKQGDDPAWYEQQDDPPLLNSDFDLCGDYHQCIVYKYNLTPNMYTLTGQILVHENDVFFDTPGDEAFVDAHSNKHDDTEVDIEASGLMLIIMSAVRIQTLTWILIQVTMDHARYQRHHVITMPFALVLPGFQQTSSRRLSRSPPIMQGCLSIPSFENALSLPILQSTYNDMMNR
jgi:hypothetical protein